MRFWTKLFLVLALLLAVLYYSQKAQYSGIVFLNRDQNKVIVFRDENGVPTIKAKKLKEVIYGLGYAQAQDRLFSMHLNRMIPQGRVSEIFGEKSLKIDIRMRQYGLHRVARKMEQNLSPRSRELLQAYADGVNDYVSSLRWKYLPFSNLPLEFQLLRVDFHPWTITDSLSFMKLINLMLSLDHNYEFIRQELAEHYGREYSDLIMANKGSGLFENTTIMNDEELKQMGLFELFKPSEKYSVEKKYKPFDFSLKDLNTQELLIQDHLQKIYLSTGASNAWAISGQHTTTGKPILANDPHLMNKIPSVWQLVNLIFEDSSYQKQIVSGGSMPGIGAVLSGRNNYVAFGVTTLYVDVTDYVIEEIKGNEYLYEGKYHPLKTIREYIKIKGQEKEHLVEIKQTHHGPVLVENSNLLQKRAASWMWAGAVQNDTVYDGVYSLIEAKSVKDVEDALYKASGPPQAIVWATVDNHIGFFGNGLIPVKKSLAHYGYPVDGTTSESEWAGFVRREHQPRLVDPKKGYVVVGNNKFATDNIVNRISYNVQTTARGKRITEMIDEKIRNGEKISVEFVKEIQQDVQDSYMREALPSFLKLWDRESRNFLEASERERLNPLIQYLRVWDSRYETESVAASIMTLWEHRLHDNFFRNELRNETERRQIALQLKCVLSDHFFLKQVQEWSLQRNLDSKWCLRNETKTPNPCLSLFFDSLSQAADFLENRFGTQNPEKWLYGDLHQHTFPHQPFSQVPVLSGIYERKFRGKGNQRTVHVSTPDEFDESFNGVNGANLMLIHSLDDQDKSYWLTDTGISENPFSKHYDDMFNLYKQDLYLPLIRSEKYLTNKHQHQSLTLRGKKRLLEEPTFDL